MSNVSPSVMLLWGILSCIELVYLFVHLWRYDRLQVSYPPRIPNLSRSLISFAVSEVELWPEPRCFQEGNDLWLSYVHPLYW